MRLPAADKPHHTPVARTLVLGECAAPGGESVAKKYHGEALSEFVAGVTSHTRETFPDPMVRDSENRFTGLLAPLGPMHYRGGVRRVARCHVSCFEGKFSLYSRMALPPGLANAVPRGCRAR